MKHDIQNDDTQHNDTQHNDRDLLCRVSLGGCWFTDLFLNNDYIYFHRKCLFLPKILELYEASVLKC